MNTAEKVRLILLEEFVKAQARNPNYSMRSYAKKIGLAQSVVSEILSGKRPLSKKTAQKILEGLDKSLEEIAIAFDDGSAAATATHRSIDMDTFHVISDWYHHAILSLVETKEFQSSEAWIAERLGITEKVASEAIEKLLRLEMLFHDSKTGKLKATGQQFEAISAVANPALRKANRQNLELAAEALEQVALSERDFTAITLCMRLKKNLSEYITKIAKLGGYIARSSDPPPGNQVIWRGFKKLNEINIGVELAKNFVGN